MIDIIEILDYCGKKIVLIALLLLLKVLVVSDIKKDLGYTGSSSGHKAWREVGFYLHFPAVMF